MASFSGCLLKFYWCVLGDQHQQEKVDLKNHVSTKDRQQQSPGSKVDSEILVFSCRNSTMTKEIPIFLNFVLT